MLKERNIQINIVDKFDKNADLRFWLEKSPQERVDAVEFLRSQYYALSGYESIPRFVPVIQMRAFRN